MQNNTRQFLEDLTQPGDIKNKPSQNIIGKTSENTFQWKPDYREFAMEKAIVNARLINEHAEKEINEILCNVERIKSEYETKIRQCEERIEKKQIVIYKLNGLTASIENNFSSLDPSSSRSAEIYNSINSQAKRLSVITAILDELVKITESLEKTQ